MMHWQRQYPSSVLRSAPAATFAALLLSLLYSASGVCDSLAVSVVNSVGMGSITPGSSNTTFTVSNTGSVTQTPASGSGGATRSTSSLAGPLQVSLSCSTDGTAPTGGDGCAKTNREVVIVLDMANSWTTTIIDLPSMTFSSNTGNLTGCSAGTYDTTNNSLQVTCKTGGTSQSSWSATLSYAFTFMVGSTAYSTYPGNDSTSISANASWAW